MRLRCIFQDSVCTDDLLLKLPNVMTPDLARLPAETIERSVAGSRRIARGCAWATPCCTEWGSEPASGEVVVVIDK